MKAVGLANGMVEDMYGNDGADDSYENELDDDEKKAWDKLMCKLIGIIYGRIGDAALAKVWWDTWEQCQENEDTYHYALYHCVEALRSECVHNDTIGKDIVRTQHELALQSRRRSLQAGIVHQHLVHDVFEAIVPEGMDPAGRDSAFISLSGVHPTRRRTHRVLSSFIGS